jgi:hypothetical protein
MKTKNKLIITAMALVAIITISLMATACKDGDEEEPTVRSSGTERPLTFGTGCKVTIKSDDKFTDDDWNTLCNKVVDAIMRGYSGLGTSEKNDIVTMFASGQAKVVLENDLGNSWEVKSGEIKTMHIKTGSINTVDLSGGSGALMCMNYGVAQVGKVLLKKENGNTPVFANVNCNYQIENKKTSLS